LGSASSVAAVEVVPSVEVIGERADVIFSSLANDQVVKDILAKVLAGAASATSRSKKVFVEMSTLYPTVVGTLGKGSNCPVSPEEIKRVIMRC
jgi:3-hydroxyisobutyrate dehydrogenase-like beta-hydroxyacid dehydrogenase